MSNGKMLPCPFCGCAKVPKRQGNGIGDYWLECFDCGAGTRLREDGAGNQKDWNRRPDCAPTAAAPVVHRAAEKAGQQPVATDVVLDDLSTLVVRLVRALRKASPGNDLPAKALEYLYRKDLAPSVLRGGAFGEFASPAAAHQPASDAFVEDELYGMEVALGTIRREHPEKRRVIAGLESVAKRARSALRDSEGMPKELAAPLPRASDAAIAVIAAVEAEKYRAQFEKYASVEFAHYGPHALARDGEGYRLPIVNDSWHGLLVTVRDREYELKRLRERAVVSQELTTQQGDERDAVQWHMAAGDWREELVALHGPQGHIVSGLTVEQAKAIIAAHGGTAPTASSTAGIERLDRAGK